MRPRQVHEDLWLLRASNGEGVDAQNAAQFASREIEYFPRQGLHIKNGSCSILPEPPFVFLQTDPKLSHIIWRTPITVSQDLWYVRLGGRQLAVTFTKALVKKALDHFKQVARDSKRLNPHRNCDIHLLHLILNCVT